MQRKISTVEVTGRRSRIATRPVRAGLGLMLGLIVILILAPACSLSPSRSIGGYSAYDWPVAEPAEVGLDAAVLAEAVEDARRLGFVRSLLVVRQGRLVTEEYFFTGGFTRNRPWDMRSLTKSVTSALVGAMLRDGYLDSLDQTLVEFLPELLSPDSDPRKEEITLFHLLTMTAGFPDDDASPLSGGESDHLQAIFDLPLIADPGTAWAYSSLGVHLLSGVISRLTERNALTFARTALGDQLDITFYHWDADPAGYSFGGTGLFLMPRDMARFGFLYLKEGFVGGRQVLPAEWVRDSLRIQVGGNWQVGGIEDLGYGYLWWTGTLGGYRIHIAWGYAGQHIFLVPEAELIVVTTASFPADQTAASAQTEAIVALLRDAILPAL